MAIRTLVTYYSRTGHTRGVAQAIAAELKADIEEIRDRRDPDGRIGVLRAIWEAVRRIPAPIADPQRLPTSYDLVVVCGPIWSGRMSSPIRGYLTRYGAGIENAGFVVTMGGRDGSRVLHDMHALAGCESFETLAVSDAELGKTAKPAGLDAFLDALRRRVQMPAQSPVEDRAAA